MARYEGTVSEYKYSVEFADAVLEKSSLFVDLLKEVFPRSGMNFDIYRWKHVDNPSGPSIVSWCEDSTGMVVGFRALWSQRLVLNGKVYKGYQPCDTATKTEHRGGGVSSRLVDISMKYAIQCGGDAIFNFPNSFSFPLYKKLGWSEPQGVRRYVRIARASKVLRRYEDWRRPFVPDLKGDSTMRIDFSSLRYSPHRDCISAKIDEDILNWRFNDHPRFLYYGVSSDSNDLSVFRVGRRGELREAEFAFVSGRGWRALRGVSNELKSSEEVDCMSIVANSSFPFRAGFVPVPSSINFVRKSISATLTDAPFDLQPMQIDVV